ncbi:hypothetical protein [Mycoplasmopsis cricetuli]|uniref:hypothetical protein n=1 Tax=Mycoplasmopsis cricetuli TaxID=171283 RepID=UPI0012EB2A22|nr:hypothetical protein [Mycoplasmopsis cricetuli]
MTFKKLAENLIVKRTIVEFTSWASPIGKFISVADNVLAWSSLFNEFSLLL